jgi:hypothetical protein
MIYLFRAYHFEEEANNRDTAIIMLCCVSLEREKL